MRIDHGVFNNDGIAAVQRARRLCRLAASPGQKNSEILFETPVARVIQELPTSSS
jgi:hypothetical protein